MVMKKIPSQDVTKLQGVSENGIAGIKFTRAFDPLLTQAWEIDSSKILTGNLDLSTLVISHLGLPADKIMVTQAKLTKLIMYQAGGRYEHNLNNPEKEFGIITLRRFEFSIIKKKPKFILNLAFGIRDIWHDYPSITSGRRIRGRKS